MPTSVSAPDNRPYTADQGPAFPETGRLVRWQRKRPPERAVAARGGPVDSVSSESGRAVEVGPATRTTAEHASAAETADTSPGRIAARSSTVGRPRSPLTCFILSLPVDLLLNDVVAKAAEKGMRCSTSNVQRVRSLDRRSTQKKPLAVPKPAPRTICTIERSSAPSTSPQTSNAAGSQLDPKRSARAAGETGATKPTRERTAPRKIASAANPKPNALRKSAAGADGHASAPELLRALAAEIGLGRALHILREQRRTVLQMLGA
jgi:hypothetical protein